MKEINDLNDEEYKNLEKEVYQDFKEREIKVKEKNESVEANSSSEISIGDNRGIEDEEGDFFNLNINPKLCVRTGLGMNNYMKINGKINPSRFMNSLASKINSELEEKGGKIEEIKDRDNLKFEVTFEDNEEEKEEEEQTEEDKKLEEELDKMGLGNVEDFEDGLEKKASVIQVKLFESANGGYIVRFVKKGGEIEDYHKNLDDLIKIVKKLL